MATQRVGVKSMVRIDTGLIAVIFEGGSLFQFFSEEYVRQHFRSDYDRFFPSSSRGKMEVVESRDEQEVERQTRWTRFEREEGDVREALRISREEQEEERKRGERAGGFLQRFDDDQEQRGRRWGAAPPAPRRDRPIGIPNYGNTCFLNAALQTLLHTRAIRDSFSPQQPPPLHLLNKLKEGRSVSRDEVRALLKLLHEHNANIVPGQPGDSVETLSLLLDLLSDPKNDAHEVMPPHDMFRSMFTTRIVGPGRDALILPATYESHAFFSRVRVYCPVGRPDDVRPVFPQRDVERKAGVRAEVLEQERVRVTALLELDDLLQGRVKCNWYYEVFSTESCVFQIRPTRGRDFRESMLLAAALSDARSSPSFADYAAPSFERNDKTTTQNWPKFVCPQCSGACFSVLKAQFGTRQNLTRWVSELNSSSDSEVKGTTDGAFARILSTWYKTRMPVRRFVFNPPPKSFVVVVARPKSGSGDHVRVEVGHPIQLDLEFDGFQPHKYALQTATYSTNNRGHFEVYVRFGGSWWVLSDDDPPREEGPPPIDTDIRFLVSATYELLR